MRPTGKRLERHNPPVTGADDRLIMYAELAAVERQSQVVFESGAGPLRGARPRVEYLEASFAAGLRAIHREVGVTEKLLVSFDSNPAKRDPNAGGDDNLAPVTEQRHVQRFLHSLPHTGRVGRIPQVVEEYGEFVTAEPRKHIARPHGSLEPPRNTGEQAIAGQVAEAVVDLLEPIEIEEEQTNGPVRSPLHARDGPLEILEEVRTIHETR